MFSMFSELAKQRIKEFHAAEAADESKGLFDLLCDCATYIKGDTAVVEFEGTADVDAVMAMELKDSIVAVLARSHEGAGVHLPDADLDVAAEAIIVEVLANLPGDALAAIQRFVADERQDITGDVSYRKGDVHIDRNDDVYDQGDDDIAEEDEGDYEEETAIPPRTGGCEEEDDDDDFSIIECVEEEITDDDDEEPEAAPVASDATPNVGPLVITSERGPANTTKYGASAILGDGEHVVKVGTQDYIEFAAAKSSADEDAPVKIVMYPDGDNDGAPLGDVSNDDFRFASTVAAIPSTWKARKVKSKNGRKPFVLRDGSLCHIGNVMAIFLRSTPYDSAGDGDSRVLCKSDFAFFPTLEGREVPTHTARYVKPYDLYVVEPMAAELIQAATEADSAVEPTRPDQVATPAFVEGLLDWRAHSAVPTVNPLAFAKVCCDEKNDASVAIDNDSFVTGVPITYGEPTADDFTHAPLYTGGPVATSAVPFKEGDVLFKNSLPEDTALATDKRAENHVGTTLLCSTADSGHEPPVPMFLITIQELVKQVASLERETHDLEARLARCEATLRDAEHRDNND